MAQAGENSEYTIEEIKKKVKRQRSMIAFLSGAVFIFTIMYLL